jgi:hypothetical protein
MGKSLNMNYVNCALLVVVLILVIVCCIKKPSKEGFRRRGWSNGWRLQRARNKKAAAKKKKDDAAAAAAKKKQDDAAAAKKKKDDAAAATAAATPIFLDEYKKYCDSKTTTKDPYGWTFKYVWDKDATKDTDLECGTNQDMPPGQSDRVDCDDTVNYPIKCFEEHRTNYHHLVSKLGLSYSNPLPGFGLPPSPPT